MTCWVLFRLRKAERLITPYRYLPSLGKQLIISKVGTAALAGICDILALAAWLATKQNTPGNPTVIASLGVRTAASVSRDRTKSCNQADISHQVLTLPLVYLEFFRKLQASPILTLFLLATALCDAARVRTFAFVDLSGSKLFFATFTAAYAFRLVLLLLETAPKDRFVEKAEGDRPLAAEETSSFIARILITSVDPVLWRGFRGQLSLPALGAIHSQYDAGTLYETGHPHWERHL